MDNKHDHIFLSRTLLQLFPDIFFHPLWIGFREKNLQKSSALGLELFRSARQLQSSGDIPSACQVLLICAALQKKSGDYLSALNNVQRAWSLAEQYELTQISKWAAWGASAINLCLPDEKQAGKHLEWLQRRLSQEGNWVLANIINIIKRTILEQTQERSEIRISLEWMRNWGEVLPDEYLQESNGHPTRRAQKANGLLGSIQQGWQHFRRGWERVQERIFGQNSNNGQVEPLSTMVHENQVAATMKHSVLLPGDRFSPSAHRNWQLPQTDSQIPPTLHPAYNEDPNPLIPSPDKISLMVYCLGNFFVYQNDVLIDNWSSKKALSIFKYLITHRSTTVKKDILMDIFWPEADPESARRNLHQAIYALRQTLNQNHPGFQHIEFWNDCYRLNPELEIWVDSEEFEKHIENGQRFESVQASQYAITEYSLAEGLYQDSFMLDDLYEEWCQSYRQHLWQRYLLLVSRLSEYYFERAEYPTVMVLNRRILTKDNCQESAHQYLMRCYLAQGQRHLALSQYRFCAQALQNELDLPPSDETEELYKMITGES